MACAPTSDIYQLKITLKGTKPPIWRRVLVPKDSTFRDLHFIINEAMGWFDTHMHDFQICSRGRIETVIGMPDDEDRMSRYETIDERKIKIFEVLKSPNDKIMHVYDYGDGWEHNVLLEKILPSDPKLKYPTCIAGKRACPPENCGGIFGYYRLIEILSNPSHPEHNDKKEWLARTWTEDWKPEVFNHKDIDLIEQVAYCAEMRREMEREMYMEKMNFTYESLC